MTLHIKRKKGRKEIQTLIIRQVKRYYFDAIVSDDDENFIPVLRYIVEDEDEDVIMHFINVQRMIYFKENEENENNN